MVSCRRYLLLATLPLILLVSGCGSVPRYAGGQTSVKHTETVSETAPEGTTRVKENTTEVTSSQPENAATPALIDINGKKINTSTGQPQEVSAVATALGRINFLNPLLYAGIILILGGVAVFAITKNLNQAGIIAGAGLGMVVLSYLLVSYGMYILIGCLLVAAIAAVYLLYKYRKAVVEQVSLTEVMKKELPTSAKSDIFEGDPTKGNVSEVKTIISSSTKDIVDAVRVKEGYKS